MDFWEILVNEVNGVNKVNKVKNARLPGVGVNV